ncbi:hypothetical protein [Solirubrobacter deserti]|uniref:HNH endonuclease n=1 Tax=Solirubrobacter deserti TaxID=2282478 RepID=A0ABT4RDJ7_9ACTN|nr:hypothetical protein [Solirubrobacter deserti]MDA0136405.1 hypothetical protein [Solirubrobacter deserti]
MASKACIFCGGTPLTREHLWPDWLRRELEIKAGFDWRMQQESDGTTTRDQAWTAPPFNQQVKAVCARCNNGWMSEIESAAKPILQALVRAEGRQLHRRMQRTLATWAFLKACIFDELHPAERTVPEAHRQFLYEHKEPPPDGVWIRVATYEARDIGHYAYQGIRLGKRGEPEPAEVTVYFVTMTAVALVLQVTGSLLDEWRFKDVPYPDEFAVAEIWPSSARVDFKQRNLLTHETLIGFTKALYNVMGSLTAPVPRPL